MLTMLSNLFLKWHVHEMASLQHVDNPSESSEQQFSCHSAARDIGGLRVEPVYEIGLSLIKSNR